MPLVLVIDTNYFKPLTMLCIALTAFWAWGTFLPVAAAAETQQVTAAHETDLPILFEQLDKRQANNASACKAYGVDYQDGGNYFVDQKSTALFKAVTQFEGYVRPVAALRCSVGSLDVVIRDGMLTDG